MVQDVNSMTEVRLCGSVEEGVIGRSRSMACAKTWGRGHGCAKALGKKGSQVLGEAPVTGVHRAGQPGEEWKEGGKEAG